MNNNFWTKITNFKILGKTIFSKEEICKETNYDKDYLEIYVTPDYYKSEFDVDKPKE
jgi:hypothetical protein